MEENRQAYSRIDSDTRDMLEVVANVIISETFKTVEKGEERYDMCKAFEDMRQEGIDIGRKEGIRILIQAYRELGVPQDTIAEKCAEKYGITKDAAGEYVRECFV